MPYLPKFILQSIEDASSSTNVFIFRCNDNTIRYDKETLSLSLEDKNVNIIYRVRIHFGVLFFSNFIRTQSFFILAQREIYREVALQF